MNSSLRLQLNQFEATNVHAASRDLDLAKCLRQPAVLQSGASSPQQSGVSMGRCSPPSPPSPSPADESSSSEDAGGQYSSSDSWADIDPALNLLSGACQGAPLDWLTETSHEKPFSSPPPLSPTSLLRPYFRLHPDTRDPPSISAPFGAGDSHQPNDPPFYHSYTATQQAEPQTSHFYTATQQDDTPIFHPHSAIQQDDHRLGYSYTATQHAAPTTNGFYAANAAQPQSSMSSILMSHGFSSASASSHPSPSQPLQPRPTPLTPHRMPRPPAQPEVRDPPIPAETTPQATSGFMLSSVLNAYNAQNVSQPKSRKNNRKQAAAKRKANKSSPLAWL